MGTLCASNGESVGPVVEELGTVLEVRKAAHLIWTAVLERSLRR